MASYHKRTEEKEKKGHNHPYKEKCGPHCPRNENYKGPVKKFDFFTRKSSSSTPKNRDTHASPAMLR